MNNPEKNINSNLSSHNLPGMPEKEKSNINTKT